jgi:arginine decarboxylase-like protein
MRVTNQILWDIYQSYDCSRTEFSIILGYGKSNSNVSLWLNGTKDLSLDQLEKFCNKLGKKLTIKIEKL